MTHTLIIIIGITGDLARRQLLPALYHLVADGRLSHFGIIGAAYQTSEAASLWQSAIPFIGSYDATILQSLIAHTETLPCDATDKDAYKKIQLKVAAYEKIYGKAHHLVYCATPSTLFEAITAGCVEHHILVKQEAYCVPWHRIVYEKPFGYDQKSAYAINNAIAQQLCEQQIFRIDHYLTKEIVSNIALIRFTNAVFEPLWNNRFIDQVHIVAAEKIGVEGRGVYYDAYGAVRDVVQNHMLQLLALIGMETPTKLSGDAIRDVRVKVLQSLTCDDGLYGQYVGYQEEQNVTQDSQTETYALLKCGINTPRWRGVPFYLMTGKMLAKKETVIHIKFKTVDCLLAKQCPAPANWLTIRVTPDAVFTLTLNGKDPAESDAIMPIEMSFCHSCQFTLRDTQAYEQALGELLRGEQSGSVRFDEIDASWQFIDAVKQKRFPVYQYEPGTSGPKEVARFAHNHGIRWHP